MLSISPQQSQWAKTMPPPREIKVLLLDDSNFDRARIRRLSNKCNLMIHLDEVESLEQLNKAVARENYDVILIDYRLPVGDGLDALNMVSENPRNRGAGKVMITGDSARETVINAMRNGCHDFLSKEDMDEDALSCAIRNALQSAFQMQQLQQQAEAQKEIIRQGLVEAIKDREVQGNVISIVRSHLDRMGALGPVISTPEDLETLLGYLDGEDEFIFH